MQDEDGSSDYTRTSSSTNGHYDPKSDVILWFEYITSARLKVIKRSLKLDRVHEDLYEV